MLVSMGRDARRSATVSLDCATHTLEFVRQDVSPDIRDKIARVSREDLRVIITRGFTMSYS